MKLRYCGSMAVFVQDLNRHVVPGEEFEIRDDCGLVPPEWEPVAVPPSTESTEAASPRPRARKPAGEGE